MGVIADVRRGLKLARQREFTCPACARVIPAAEMRFHSRRGFCPYCGGIVLAPPGQPTGLGVMPPPPDQSQEPAGVLASLGILPAAVGGTLALYTFWMFPGFVRASAIGYLGWRPIGWESTALTALTVAVGIALALVPLSFGVVGTRRLPGTPVFVTTFVVVIMAVAAFHGFLVMPWSERMTHANDWPAALGLVDFSVCADTFDLGSSTLSADGVVRFQVENRSRERLRLAAFTVKTGRPSDWFEHNAQYRWTIRDLAPGERREIHEHVHLGHVMWSGANDSGGPAAAPAIIMWDTVEFADRGEVARASRPAAATVQPIPDCAGTTRPDVPWLVPPYTGPP